MYAGYFKFKGNLIKGVNFPAIISYETYWQAQARVETNRSKRSVKNSPYLLTGLIYCLGCGNRYVGKLYDRYIYKNGKRENRHVYRSYGCAARVKRDKKYHYALCNNAIIPSHKLEELIENKVKSIRFADFIDSSLTSNLADSLLAETFVLNNKKNKLLDLYLEQAIDKDALIQRLTKIEAKLTQNKLAIESEANTVLTVPASSLSVLQNNLTDYDNLDKKDKSLLLKFLIKSIVIDGENITLNLNLKQT